MTRPELDTALRALETSIPTIKTWGSVAAQLATFNADAFAIRWSANRRDAAYANDRLEKMLHSSWIEPTRTP
jgi:hypothetical protein